MNYKISTLVMKVLNKPHCWNHIGTQIVLLGFRCFDIVFAKYMFVCTVLIVFLPPQLKKESQNSFLNELDHPEYTVRLNFLEQCCIFFQGRNGLKFY